MNTSICLHLHSPIKSFAPFAKNISATWQECSYQVFVRPWLPHFSEDLVIVGKAGSTSAPHAGEPAGTGAAEERGQQPAQGAGKGSDKD